jgi:glycosyltransferase involved in cell wall biosynthesis
MLPMRDNVSLPGVTVLITAYNYGRFIEKAIESVLSQDYPADRMEVVIVDDGSTDETAEQVKKYGAKVRYFHKPNGGQASALNLGLAKTRGEIVALLDADDLFLPGKLARIVDAFQQDPSLGMVYHRLLEWYEHTGERRERSFYAISGDIHKIPDRFLSYVAEPASCISFRRSVLNPLLPIPEGIRMLGDCYLVTLIPFLAPILAVPEFLALYRIHGKNNYGADEREVSLEVRRRRLQMWRVATDAMCNWLGDNGYSQRAPERAFLNSWMLYHARQRFQNDPPGRLGFFRFLVWENYTSSHDQTWKFTVFNYLASLSALLFGYKNRHLMYEWRERTMTSLQSLSKRFFSARSKSRARDVKCD